MENYLAFLPVHVSNFIQFLPIAIYAIIGSILFYTKKINFNNQVGLLVGATVIHAILAIIQGQMFFTVGQILIAIVTFLLLVFFFSGKTSGETILTMVSIFALTPVPIGVIPMIVLFAVIFIAAGIALWRQSESIKLALLDATLSTGLSHSKPDYSHLPDRASLPADAKKTSMLPYIATVMTLASLWYLIQPLFLDS